MSAIGAGQSPKLLDQMRAVLRVQRYALRTERAYCDWVRRYVKFHAMKSREDLACGTRKVEAFLTHLAVEGRVAASTQNQALNALLFLYEKVLEQPMEDRIDAVRARRPARVPEVLTPEEARRVIALMSGPAALVVKLLYGSGLRQMEALRLRIKDVDFQYLQVTVRDGRVKGFASRGLNERMHCVLRVCPTVGIRRWALHRFLGGSPAASGGTSARVGVCHVVPRSMETDLLRGVPRRS